MPIKKRAGINAFKPLNEWNFEPKSKTNARILINLVADKKITKKTHFINKARSLGFTVSEAGFLWKKYFDVANK